MAYNINDDILDEDDLKNIAEESDCNLYIVKTLYNKMCENELFNHMRLYEKQKLMRDILLYIEDCAPDKLKEIVINTFNDSIVIDDLTIDDIYCYESSDSFYIELKDVYEEAQENLFEGNKQIHTLDYMNNNNILSTIIDMPIEEFTNQINACMQDITIKNRVLPLVKDLNFDEIMNHIINYFSAIVSNNQNDQKLNQMIAEKHILEKLELCKQYKKGKLEHDSNDNLPNRILFADTERSNSFVLNDLKKMPREALPSFAKLFNSFIANDCSFSERTISKFAIDKHKIYKIKNMNISPYDRFYAIKLPYDYILIIGALYKKSNNDVEIFLKQRVKEISHHCIGEISSIEQLEQLIIDACESNDNKDKLDELVAQSKETYKKVMNLCMPKPIYSKTNNKSENSTNTHEIKEDNMEKQKEEIMNRDEFETETDYYIYLLEQYHAMNGTSNPKIYEKFGGTKIGDIAENLKTYSLSKKQIKALKKINFNFTPKSPEDILEEYSEEENKTNFDDVQSDVHISPQKENSKNMSKKESQKKDYTEIDYDDVVKRIERYRIQYGTTVIPKETVFEDYPLGRVCEEIRSKYKEKKINHKNVLKLWKTGLDLSYDTENGIITKDERQANVSETLKETEEIVSIPQKNIILEPETLLSVGTNNDTDSIENTTASSDIQMDDVIKSIKEVSKKNDELEVEILKKQQILCNLLKRENERNEELKRQNEALEAEIRKILDCVHLEENEMAYLQANINGGPER